VLFRIGVPAVVVLSFASVACVGDDTLATGNAPGVQGGSGPPPSSYDATVDGPGGGEDAGAPDATDASDAGSPLDAARLDAGDASDGD
jgi:hypothetical protein